MKRILPLILFAVGVAALTAFAARSLDRGPFERTPVGTESAYWTAAAQVASGTANPAALNLLPSPIYPRLLAPLASDDARAPRRAHRALTAIFVPLIAILVLVLAWKRTGPWIALVAGLGATVAAPVALNAGAFSPSVPAGVAALAALVVLDRTRHGGGWLAAGLLIGLSAALEPPLGWSLGFLLLVLALVRPGRGRRVVAAPLFAVAWTGAALVALAVSGAGSHLPLVSGVDAYRGNRAEATGVAPRRAGEDARRYWIRQDFVLELERERQEPVGFRTAEEVWGGRAVKEALVHPLATLKRLGVKTLAVFQGDPLPRDVSAAFLIQRTEGRELPVAVWIGRILLPLGLVGLVLAWRRAGGVLWAGALSGLLATILTYAEPDDRMVTVAALLVGAALFVRILVRAGTRARLTALAGGLAAVAIWGIWPVHGGVPGMGITAEDYFELGQVYDAEKRGSSAIREYERSLGMAPGNPYPRLALAAMLARDNVFEEATRELESLRADHPDFVPGLQALVHLYENQKRFSDAANVYGDLIRLDPVNPEYYNNLGTVFVQIGYYDQAVRALEAAVRIAPGYAVARDNLNSLRERGLASGPPEPSTPGSTADSTSTAAEDPVIAAQREILGYMQNGDTLGAERALDEAYQRLGRDRPELVYFDGTLNLIRGHSAEAARLLASVHDSMGNNPFYLNNLAAAYASSGQLEKARETWQEAIKLQPSNLRFQQSLQRVQAAIDSAHAGR